MAATAIETIPATWDDVRDTAFFRVTTSLFSGEFTYGAGVLLASYDDEFDAAVASSAAPDSATGSTPVSSSVTTSHAASR
jgi:hypothetical protein